MKIFLLSIAVTFLLSCSSRQETFYMPAEFEEQEYIGLSWVETGFPGGDPFYFTALDAVKEITPYVKVRLFYSEQPTYMKEQIEKRIYEKWIEHKIDTKHELHAAL